LKANGKKNFVFPSNIYLNANPLKEIVLWREKKMGAMVMNENPHCDPDWEECPGVIRRQNPATLELASEVVTFVPEQIPQVIEQARIAQRMWMELPLKTRIAKIRAVISYIRTHLEAIAWTIASETGKPKVEAINSDIIAGIAAAAYSAEQMPNLFQKQNIHFGKLHPFLRFLGRRSYLFYRPLGIIGIISPWNFPFGIPFSEVVMAVAAGNAVILKPSSETPMTGMRIQEIFEDAGFPPHLVQVIPGAGGKLGRALVTGGVDRIVFTGSAEIGAKIMEMAAQRWVPVTLELSGKDPMIILDDADLDRTLQGALWGAFVNSGQMCVGVKRIYVQHSIYDRFVPEFVKRVKELKQGWGWEDPTISVGSLINEQAIREMEGHVQRVVEQGATILTGGKRNPHLKGYFFEPTVIGNATQAMDVVQREIFGPIVAIIPFESDEDAIQMANGSEFALAGSVWTNDLTRGQRIADILRSGTITINNVAYTFGLTSTPWGGRGKSGFGRTHSLLGFHELMEPHHVHTDRGKFARELWWSPYSAEKLRVNYDFLDLTFMHNYRGLFGKLKRIWANLKKRGN
jgi:succinate-semialdehyde dehydrogenase/glutarate-semialdehyde dehydrogenase